MTESTDEEAPADDDSRDPPPDDVEALRERVEEKYDFEEFGPREMAEMSPEEWEAAFDAESWVTGEELLDRVEADLRARIAERDVFAVLERIEGEDPRLLAYSDASYAVVHADGTVEGEGPVLQDVKPTVALASMPEFEAPESPADGGLPDPQEIAPESSALGDLVLQVLGAVLLVAAVALFGAALFADLGGATIVAVFVAVVFLVLSLALLLVVANARLSARYRAEEYRERLRAAGVAEGERPDFLPVEEWEFDDEGGDG